MFNCSGFQRANEKHICHMASYLHLYGHKQDQIICPTTLTSLLEQNVWCWWHWAVTLAAVFPAPFHPIGCFAKQVPSPSAQTCPYCLSHSSSCTSLVLPATLPSGQMSSNTVAHSSPSSSFTHGGPVLGLLHLQWVQLINFKQSLLRTFSTDFHVLIES